MATETKKFLDEKMEPVSHKLMAKYIALTAVVFVILILAVLAWFTSNPEAVATGISVKSIGTKGLEVKITDHVEEEVDGEIVKSVQWTGFDTTQTYHSAFTANNPLTFVSGNGLNMFKPDYSAKTDDKFAKLNMDNVQNVVWNRFDNSDTSEKTDFIEYTMQFRNSEPANVYLNNESKVTPNHDNTTDPSTDEDTYNENCDFSRNFISATSRVAFLKKGANNSLSFQNMWIPNEKIELTNTPTSKTETIAYKPILPSATVKEITETHEQEAFESGDYDSGYSLWILNKDLETVRNSSGHMTNSTATLVTKGDRESDLEEFINNKPTRVPILQKKLSGNKYVFFVNLKLPAGYYGDIPFIITNNLNLNWVTYPDNTGQKIAENQVSLYPSKTEATDRLSGYNDSIGSFTFCTSSKGSGSNQFYQSNVNYGQYSYFETLSLMHTVEHDGTIQITFSELQGRSLYNNGLSASISTAYASIYGFGNSESTSLDVVVGESLDYPKNDDILVFTAEKDSVNKAISYSTPNTGITVDDPPAGDTDHYWIVNSMADNKSFKLRNKEGNYLTVTQDGVSTGSDGSYFYAVSKVYKKVDSSLTEENLNGVMLYCMDVNLYINYSPSGFVVSKDYDKTYTYKMYKQDKEETTVDGGWGLILNGSPEGTPTNPFYYQKKTGSGSEKGILTHFTDYFLTEDIHLPEKCTSIATKSEAYPSFIVNIGGEKHDDGYYYSDEIVVRIWGEGYDREAHRPMEYGMFKASLYFTAVPITSNN